MNYLIPTSSLHFIPLDLAALSPTAQGNEQEFNWKMLSSYFSKIWFSSSVPLRFTRENQTSL